MKLLYGTGNQAKISAMRQRLKELDIELIGLEDMKEQGYENNINEQRLHHEIYMSDARKVAPEKWKTVIRHPIKKV